MEFPLSRYKYFEHSLPDGSIEIIAMSTYAGRPVKGKAKCHPADTFDREKGRKLAALRCNLKIAEKRRDRAVACRDEAEQALFEAKSHYEDMYNYWDDAIDRYMTADAKLQQFYEANIKNR